MALARRDDGGLREIPGPVSPPSGCRFHTRCPVAEPQCVTDEPPLRPVGPNGAMVACHLVSDSGHGPHLVEPVLTS